MGEFTLNEGDDEGKHHHEEVGVSHEVVGLRCDVYALEISEETFLDSAREAVHNKGKDDEEYA